VFFYFFDFALTAFLPPVRVNTKGHPKKRKILAIFEVGNEEKTKSDEKQKISYSW